MSDPTWQAQRALYDVEFYDFELEEETRAAYGEEPPAEGHEYACHGCGALLWGMGTVEMCRRCEEAWT